MKPRSKKIVLLYFICTTFLSWGQGKDFVVDFPSVPMKELVRFVSRLSQVNFIADESLLNFDVSFYSGKAANPEELVHLLIELMHHNGLEAKKQGDYYIVKKTTLSQEMGSLSPSKPTNPLPKEGKFQLFKLQYHPGAEIMSAIKSMSGDLLSTGAGDEAMLATIGSMQWIESTNSLFCSGSPMCLEEMAKLIESLDTPIKQVFIEVLVIETNTANSLDFGVQWAANGKIKNKIGLGTGTFEPSEGGSFAETMRSVNHESPPTGLGQIPLVRGFDLGIIGDLIFHKGKSFLSLGSLVSMLQNDSEYSIVLNQKILAQENKNSTIFVGNNLPFAGAVVQTIGSSQQTTANIEYRDVGVSLNITPLIGKNGIITLKISEEITEAIDQVLQKGQQVNGIKTSKTNMSTNAHVPNGHFLILSGMTRNIEGTAKSGAPCLGGIPMIGSLFSKKQKKNDKSSILIFVKPTIIHGAEEHVLLTSTLKD